MGGPSWLTGIFAAASLAVAVYCVGRLIAARRWRRPTELDTDGAHVVMGVAMAGMLVSGLHTLPSAIWEVVFAAGAAWFGYRMYQGRHGARPSGYVVWLGDRVALHAPALAIAGPAGDTRPPIGSGPGLVATRSYLAPRCAAICKITMGITMGYMLILMLEPRRRSRAGHSHTTRSRGNDPGTLILYRGQLWARYGRRLGNPWWPGR